MLSEDKSLQVEEYVDSRVPPEWSSSDLALLV